jgi:hypothetical protein
MSYIGKNIVNYGATSALPQHYFITVEFQTFGEDAKSYIGRSIGLVEN